MKYSLHISLYWSSSPSLLSQAHITSLSSPLKVILTVLRYAATAFHVALSGIGITRTSPPNTLGLPTSSPVRILVGNICFRIKSIAGSPTNSSEGIPVGNTTLSPVTTVGAPIASCEAITTGCILTPRGSTTGLPTSSSETIGTGVMN